MTQGDELIAISDRATRIELASQDGSYRARPAATCEAAGRPRGWVPVPGPRGRILTWWPAWLREDSRNLVFIFE